MTAVDLAELRRLADAATEGPWLVWATVSGFAAETNLDIGPDNAPTVAVVAEGLGDADFIAAAREALPALVAFAADVLALADDDQDDHADRCGSMLSDDYECSCWKADLRDLAARHGITDTKEARAHE